MRTFFTLAIGAAAFFLLVPVIVPSTAEPLKTVQNDLSKSAKKAAGEVVKVAEDPQVANDVPAGDLLATPKNAIGNDISFEETMNLQTEALEELGRLKQLVRRR